MEANKIMSQNAGLIYYTISVTYFGAYLIYIWETCAKHGYLPHLVMIRSRVICFISMGQHGQMHLPKPTVKSRERIITRKKKKR